MPLERAWLGRGRAPVPRVLPGERKICKAILKLLNDQSSDVQGLAVKCLSPLVRKVHDAQVDEVMVELCSSVLTGKEEQRDICAIG